MDLVQEFAAVIDALSAARIDYAVCGGMAVNIYGHVRATRDIDLLIREESLQPVLDAVKPLGFVMSSGRIPFGFGTPQHRELFRVSKVGAPAVLTLDLMLVTAVFEDVWRDRQHAEWSGRRIPVVSRRGLLRMKRLAGRAQDLADIENLGLDGDDAS